MSSASCSVSTNDSKTLFKKLFSSTPFEFQDGRRAFITSRSSSPSSPQVSPMTSSRRAVTTNWSQRSPRTGTVSPGPRSTPPTPESPTSSSSARSATWRPSEERNSRYEESGTFSALQLCLKVAKIYEVIKKGGKDENTLNLWLCFFLGHGANGGRQVERGLPQLPSHLWDQRRKTHRGKSSF